MVELLYTTERKKETWEQSLNDAENVSKGINSCTYYHIHLTLYCTDHVMHL